MMTNSNQALYNISRAAALAVVLLTVGPVVTGCYNSLRQPVQQMLPTGETIVYRSSAVAAVDEKQFSYGGKGDLPNAQSID